MKNVKMGTYVRNDETHTFNFGTDLSISDKAKFVNFVTSLVVDDENYNSIIRDLIFNFCIIDFFTDINTEEFKQSINFLDDVEEFLLSTNIVEIIKANAFPTLFEELNNAVDKSIEYRTGIHPSPLNEALASLVSTFEKKVKEFDMDSAMEMVSLLTEMTGDISPESIVNAYLNSDLHQKNLDEITKVKEEQKKE